MAWVFNSDSTKHLFYGSTCSVICIRNVDIYTGHLLTQQKGCKPFMWNISDRSFESFGLIISVPMKSQHVWVRLHFWTGWLDGILPSLWACGQTRWNHQCTPGTSKTIRHLSWITASQSWQEVKDEIRSMMARASHLHVCEDVISSM